MIVQQGTINTTAQIAPGVLVQVVAPRVRNLNGVPTNFVGIVGSATFGPVNQPIVVGSYAEYERVFGPLKARDHDAGTALAVAHQQAASAFVVVRVTDGTDTAATAAVQTNCLTLTAKHTGSRGNSIKLTIGNGSKADTFRAVVAIPGAGLDEVFDNIAGSGNAFWVNLAAAINSGTAKRGPSALVSATAGAGTTAPTLNTPVTLASGTDGATSLDSADLLGADTGSRSGMYALRGTLASIGVLADADDSTWSAQAAFGLAEGIYMIAAAAKGSTISEAIADKATAGVDSWSIKVLHGDWVYWNDLVNGQTRLVSPQGFVAGRLSNLSPNESSLNKPIYHVLGTQKSSMVSGSAASYSDAETTQLLLAGLDFISNPAPGGGYWAARGGINASSDDSIDGDNYPRMTNYLAVTLNTGMGQFIGRTATPQLFDSIHATITSLLMNMQSQGLLSIDADGTPPFSVVCDASNNPASRVQLGYVQADVQVRYDAIVRHFIVNLEGGQTTSVTIR